jgi:predicted negative regulator of RcsB-dependent stress response
MNENILTWNVENWITVILMAAIGFFLVGLAQKWWQSHHAAGNTNATS